MSMLRRAHALADVTQEGTGEDAEEREEMTEVKGQEKIGKMLKLK